MQFSETTESSSILEGVSDSTLVKLKEETKDSSQMDKIIRCLCGSKLPTDSMVKCEDPMCNVWQHISCVVIPEKEIDGVLPNPPECFYCEICRLSRADPFWVTVAHLLYPVKLNITNIPTDGSNPVQTIEETFQLTTADKELSSKQEYDIQAWCMLLNDKVTFRMQWPQYADIQVNGVRMRAINRPDSQLLGANGRDDGPIITPCTREGINTVSVTGSDARIFCVGVRIIKRRSLQQVLSMIPKESEGVRFEDALDRVCRCLGGGAHTENADSDSDIEIVADSITVNLRCPMSGSRMKVAGRFEPCVHMGCFDLEVFVEMNQRSRKWQCPICLKNYFVGKIVIDPYFNRILSMMNTCGKDVTEIEVKPDGSWRAKAESNNSRSLGEIGLWHLPDGTICTSMDTESKLKPENKLIKQEVEKIGNSLSELHNNGNIIISVSSSDSGREGDNDATSVNQDCNENLDFSAVTGPTHEINGQNLSAPAGWGTEVIVLSDSEEENESRSIYDFPARPIDESTVQIDLSKHSDLSNGNWSTDDWISHWLEDSKSESAADANGLSSDCQVQPKDGELDSVPDTGELKTPTTTSEVENATQK